MAEVSPPNTEPKGDVPPSTILPAKVNVPNRRDATPLTYYAKAAVSEARRFGRGFTRENLIGTIKTLAWVIPLTVLIWVYAEREQSKSVPDVTISIGVVSTDPNRIVTLVRPAEGNITCSLVGPQSKLDQVTELLQPHGNAPPILIEVGPDVKGQNESIPLLARIQDNPKFKNNGVSVVHCTPENLVVSVDELETRDVPVIAPAGIPSLESCTFNPSTIKVRGPSRVLKALEASHHLSVTADIANRTELSEPGPHVLENVNLLPPDSNINLITPTVQATLVVKEANETYSLTNLPVMLLGPGSSTSALVQPLLSQYKVTYDSPLAATVTVTGPPSEINRIKDHEFKPYAALRVFEVEASDLTNPKIKATLLLLGLPPGVTVTPDSESSLETTYQVARQ